MEDMLAVLDESIDNDDEECVSDEILDKFEQDTRKKKIWAMIIFRRKKNGLKKWSWSMNFTNSPLMKC